MARGKGKGSQFERDVCRQLSYWWSRVGDDDLFWRTQSSGARATQRKKRGKRTRGQYGDICAVDSRGRYLTKACIVSLKRGYPRVTLSDLIDISWERKNQGELASWIKECITHMYDARTPGWLLVMKRNNREPIVLMPLSFMWRLAAAGAKLKKAEPQVIVLAKLGKDFEDLPKKRQARIIKKKKGALRYHLRHQCGIFGMEFKQFLKLAKREHFVKVAKQF